MSAGATAPMSSIDEGGGKRRGEGINFSVGELPPELPPDRLKQTGICEDDTGE